ncbi:MAG TPA: hypothetical protein VM618_04475, partial [Acidimicrobiia bacterium]|nr:hypothetical protein [Acidimicrobiia bacterium]
MRRLLVVTLPTVTWSLLDAADTPNLDRLFERSAVGDLAVRVVRRKTDAATGYTTLGAGTRAGSSSVAGMALGPDERFDGERAEQIYERRMGLSTDARVLSLTVPELVKRNDALLFGGEVGALGEVLKDAGIHRAVIGNADHTLDPVEASEFERQV